MTQDQKIYFIYGALYQMAKDIKNDGLFEDLTIPQIIRLFLSNEY